MLRSNFFLPAKFLVCLIGLFSCPPSHGAEPLDPSWMSEPSASDRVLSTVTDEPKQPPQARAEHAVATVAPQASPAIVDETFRDCQACAPQRAVASSSALAAQMKSAYQGVFYANKFGYLNHPQYSGPYFPGDSFKNLADGRLDLGGEYRSRYHHENNHRGLGLTGRDDQFWLSRLRLFSNYRVNKDIRFYGEYLYADSGGETFAPRPIEENRGDIQNMFFDVRLLEADSGTWNARLGRQELLLGAQRLVSPLDWANTRRTFDGYRLTYTADKAAMDLFYTNPVARVPQTAGSNDFDSSDTSQHFYGSYLSNQLGEGLAADLYYLGYDNETEDFSFHTLGSRLAGTGDILLYELEGGVQFGSNADGSSHDAGFMTAGLGRKLALSDWQPTIWMWYDWASGGDADFISQGDDGFHHLFPLGHKYNGFMDLFGRRNLHDVNVQFIAPVGSRVTALLWYHYFFLDKATTPYSVVMTPYNTTGVAGSRDLGHEIDALFTINLNPRNSVLLGYSHFNAGDYYRTTPGVAASSDADFFYFQYQTQF